MENYEILEHLVSGSFGKVCKIRRKSDNKILVWKEIEYGNMSEREKHQLVTEVNVLKELRHPNIVRFYERIIDKSAQKLWIIQEYCEGGDLSQLIKKCKKDKTYLAEEVIWKFFMQLILALHEIHRRKEGKILHRDIKPANIFLDANHNIKLGDFGLSKILTDEKGFAYSTVGTPYYMSPEQITDKKYNEKSDIWACGCLLYELCAQSPPFEASNQLSLALKIKSGKFERIPSRYSNELFRVIQWILTRDPEARPSVDDLLNIPSISMRLREKRLKDSRAMLKKKEEEVQKKLEELEAREKGLKNRQLELEEKEKRLLEEEKRLQEKEQKLKNTTTSSSVTMGHSRDRGSMDFGEYYKPKGVTINYGKYHPSSLADLGKDDKKGGEKTFDKTFNNSIDNYSITDLPRMTRYNSRVEETTMSENYLNYEINNILKDMDKIVARKHGIYDENPSTFRGDSQDTAPSISYEFHSQPSIGKVL